LVVIFVHNTDVNIVRCIGCFICRVKGGHLSKGEGEIYLKQSMKLGELRETALIVIESIVRELQRAIGVGSGIMKR
jgi:hypothetical protein